MRQGQNSKRSRGRSGGRRNSSPRHQSFDSNGPSIRIRGNASQVYEKYIQLARDANAAGDRISAENMYQHAEHYFRLMNADDGDSSRQQNRGNGADQRHQNRNQQQGQEGQDNRPSNGSDGEAHGAAAVPAQKDAGLNGSSDNKDQSGDTGASAPERRNGEAARKADDSGAERPARRPRRGTARPRTQAAEKTTEAAPQEAEAVVIEPEVVVETSPADGGEADAENKDA